MSAPPSAELAVRDPDVAALALAGLAASPKTLPPLLFYDPPGCALFAAITELPEYYVTRTEIALLRSLAPALGGLMPPGLALVEYGASDEAKAVLLLAHLRDPAAYVPIDIAPGALAALEARLRVSHPALPVLPITADFLAPLQLPARIGPPVLGFFPGSTIGNLMPEQATAFLGRARTTLGAGAHLLVGVDLRKDPALLRAAYDDAAGITARFNLNLLHRLNREAAANFDPDSFSHVALWNEAAGRMEMHLESQRAQHVWVAGRRFDFAQGERIHTENSHKYTSAQFAALAGRAGWEVRHEWCDPRGWFSAQLLAAPGT